ncbi:2-hydroxy-3-keto-5-methylthiopentenyl-1-phosphate phosphatase [Paenactinomyces guangxiensis]|uniref:2-hydroxy-3-keto-5-methylthiopentenyl-1-phosphate phosphatase n=1 Tax=Paenactinomyces guangxiensis TaxID=1490290 RepID=A0A7W2A8Y8_9BACL|nr:2-hydroxy-3-keto-5-methylthiopentenyl-1-phosphate phosphatase [Paenactinomyces guangxiensis]MBA4494358.1 2-hydroxy-3-keto-5-methylthiopentenyl-1-phosphate phosphatase [Paenactinomyces guangxiensis]MBH8591587.1 2-hydroxy-3-keto-5-methylthiopentenyl-1-phosphate phosphatase [Paenactinomyces guangxiensis]
MDPQRVIFCDFDGTITNNDNIISIFKYFNPPGWEAIKDNILAQRISIRQGVGQMFSLLPTSKKEEIIRYSIDQAEIRPGFAEFIDFCRKNEIRLLVTSGGIDFFVYPILSRFPIPIEDIYCNHSDFSGEKIRIVWPHPCDEHCKVDCGMCKTSFIRSYKDQRYEKIVIGDSITDLAAAKLADFTIARDFLLQKCRELNLSHQPFSTFYDVIDILSRMQLVK